MGLSTPHPAPAERLSWRNLTHLFSVPLALLAVAGIALAFAFTAYETRHEGMVFTGVSVWGVDLGGLSPQQAATTLQQALAQRQASAFRLISPDNNDSWTLSAADLGLSMDTAATVQAAMAIGRSGNPLARLGDILRSWYLGLELGPVLVLDEGALNAQLQAVGAAVYQPPVNAGLELGGAEPTYAPARPGRYLDVEETGQRLREALIHLRPADVELLVHDIPPAIADDAGTAYQVEQLASAPLQFYFPTPLQEEDVAPVALPAATLSSWLRSEMQTQAGGATRPEIVIDENAARQWLSELAGQVARPPVNARFYFDDNTRELVLVAPHVEGRELDVEATLAELKRHLGTADRAVPLRVREIAPAVHSDVTAGELGITELVSEKTTWFYGSSDARKHNIARSAANFFGIVIAPGEEFSFNRYLGTVSEDDGYEEGLIIVGGRTIRGIGGGVCQVSTTMFQTAFWAGFPITERWPHGYMLGYYNDGEGPGMDATVYSPIVDLRFVNNTEHHLLIENYYNEEFEALTFKFYSTSLGRTVEKEGPFFENTVPAPDEELFEFNETLEEGEVQQIDWATEGADVSVQQMVYNAAGDLIYERTYVSHYVPWPDVYHYGPGVEPPAYPPEE